MSSAYPKITFLLLALTFSACALGPRAPQIVTGPDGTPHHLISCGTIEVCYEEAAKHCQGKYKIVNTSSETSGDPEYVSSVQKLLVKCE